MWGLGDYPITPETQMRKVRELGEECLREAELAIRTVKTNSREAQRVVDFMRTYKLLADYYERKVLAATSALIYGFGGPESNKADAEKFADEAIARYEAAMTFMWEAIDRKTGNIRGKWLDGKPLTMFELIEREKEERAKLPQLFGWDQRSKSNAEPPSKGAGAPKAGTFAK
jgi:hypothetical protein